MHPDPSRRVGLDVGEASGERVGGTAIGALDEVGVDVECRGRSCMSESPGDEADVFTGRNQGCRGPVAKIMEAPVRCQAGLSPGAGPHPGEPIR